MSFRNLAYGKPKAINAYGKTWNRLTDLGVRWHQVSKFRPALIGYARGER